MIGQLDTAAAPLMDRGMASRCRCQSYKSKVSDRTRPILNCRSLIVLAVIMATNVFRTSEAIEWLGLSNDKRQLTWNQSASADCARTKVLGLVRDQRLICQRNPDLMPAVLQASKDSVDVCQELFADRRWNCSTVTLAPNYLPDLASNSREQAFVQALSSATLVHAIAKACSSGQSSKCGCGPVPTDPPPTPPPGAHQHGSPHGQGQAVPGQFKWGGCADDLRFGLVFGKWFTDMPTSNGRKMSRRAVINSHNNAVGRKIVADSLSTQCKCHGVSGSCTVKTCYRALPVDIRPTIGSALKSRYSVAVHVDDRTGPSNGGVLPFPPEPFSIRPSPSSSGGRSKSQQSRSRKNGGANKQQSTRNPTGGPVLGPGPGESQSDWPGVTRNVPSQRGGGRMGSLQARSPMDRVEAMLANKAVRDDDLIYFTISPDYCLPDPALGSVGTKDRACDKDSGGSGGCRTMCCGRGYKTETVEVRQRCDCKYYWCCYVKCKTCTKTVEIHRCR